MTPEAVSQWLAEVKSAGLASTAKEAAPLIGVTEKTMSQFKRNGVNGDAAYRTALAMAAALAGLEPYGNEKTRQP